MTTPTTTQAELEAANEISKYFGYSVSDKVRARILEILAAHRAAPPATLALTFNLDPVNDYKIARQHNDALNRIGDILIKLQNEAIERARSVFEEQKADPAQAHVSELDKLLRSVIWAFGNYGKPSLRDAIASSEALIARIDAERKVQVTL